MGSVVYPPESHLPVIGCPLHPHALADDIASGVKQRPFAGKRLNFKGLHRLSAFEVGEDGAEGFEALRSCVWVSGPLLNLSLISLFGLGLLNLLAYG